MSIPISFENLIKNNVVESARIEYKKSLIAEVVLHTIDAFANDIDNWGGGYIVIGMNEVNGVIDIESSGLKKSEIDKINKDILKISNLIEPKYIPVVDNVTYKRKNFVLIWCPGGNDRPYKCPINYIKDEKKRVYGYYVRKMSSTVKANDKMVKELFELNGDVPFDDRANNDADIKDLKNNIIDEFLNNVDSSLLENEDLSKIDIAKSLRILTGSKENMRPVNVGLMFFNERPDNFFRCAQIEVVDKPDPTGEGMTEKIFKGPLDKQLRDALMYIKNYIIKEKVHKIKGQAEAVRVFNYPYEAIEEALTNAVYHKSYRTPEPITVVSESDGLYINSVPGPDRSIKDSDIKIGKMQSVRYRNRRIGDFLKELDMAEGRNTGMPTILRTMKNNKSPKPVFKTDEDRSYFTVFLPINKDFLEDDTTPMTTREIGKTTQETTQDLIDINRSNDKMTDINRSNDKMTDINRSNSKMTDIERKTKVIELFKTQDFVNNAIVRESMDFGEATVKRLLNEMVEEGTLRAEGENKGRKYYLVNKGD